MRTIKRIFVHCTAGNQNATVEDVMRAFKARGWKNPGYHYLILANGAVHQLMDESEPSNGVRGYNSTSINVAYTGGVDRAGNAVDNRTDQQKCSLITLLKSLKECYPDAKIMGHRDISPDVNGNGIVDPWERIKECPCFDAMIEYKEI